MDEAFGPRQQMMFQQRQTFLLGDLHAGRVFAGREPCSLAEQQQLPTTAYDDTDKAVSD